MSVLLPTGGIQSANPRFIDKGGVLSSTLGGPDQRLDRLGSKWGVDYHLVPMKADVARTWIARLVRGMREKAIIKFPQPGFIDDVGADLQILATPTPAAGSESIALYIFSFGKEGKKIVEGQFISLVSPSGRSYIHQITSADVAGVHSGSGRIDWLVTIQPALKTAFAASNAAKLIPANVQIEGYVKGDDSSWTIDNAKIYGLSFSIEEAR